MLRKCFFTFDDFFYRNLIWNFREKKRTIFLHSSMHTNTTIFDNSAFTGSVVCRHLVSHRMPVIAVFSSSLGLQKQIVELSYRSTNLEVCPLLLCICAKNFKINFTYQVLKIFINNTSFISKFLLSIVDIYCINN